MLNFFRENMRQAIEEAERRTGVKLNGMGISDETCST